eukprot:CAMPEP_0117668014 /NCGR_PEP_ID=MMETSP0804-20121206/11295_1 /TAXON_ID=1074897 /ORGANISM="Tetraselmis astigmatica, Strain CCMP880" /LENGTH=424 /DNA_ID=CAMNT_0005475821 /DNA_START=172 /DNA_END=1449 /DNA_ORIENTATION=+
MVKGTTKGDDWLAQPTGGVRKGRGRAKRPPPQSAQLRDDLGVAQHGAVDYSFYADPAYWNARYAAVGGGQGAGAYEWFSAGAEELLPFLGRFIRRGDTVLEVGCGTSGLLRALLEGGHEGELVGVDCSPAAIAWARQHLAGSRTAAELAAASYLEEGSSIARRRSSSPEVGVRYEAADARDLRALFEDGTVDVVIEKGTLAGLFSEEGGEKGSGVLSEVSRLLRSDGGILVSISPHDPADDNEARNGLNVLQELVFPPLAAASGNGAAWSCEVHTAGARTSVHVYALRRRLRPLTRAVCQECSLQLDVTLTATSQRPWHNYVAYGHALSAWLQSPRKMLGRSRRLRPQGPHQAGAPHMALPDWLLPEECRRTQSTAPAAPPQFAMSVAGPATRQQPGNDALGQAAGSACALDESSSAPPGPRRV